MSNHCYRALCISIMMKQINDELYQRATRRVVNSMAQIRSAPHSKGGKGSQVREVGGMSAGGLWEQQVLWDAECTRHDSGRSSHKSTNSMAVILLISLGGTCICPDIWGSATRLGQLVQTCAGRGRPSTCTGREVLIRLPPS